MTRTRLPQPEQERLHLPHPGGDPPAEVTRLANRIALLTLFAAFATVLGLVLLPRSFAAAPVLLRVAAALPLVIAAATILYIRRLRSELRRSQQAGGAGAAPPPAGGTTPTRAPALRGMAGAAMEGPHGVER